MGTVNKLRLQSTEPLAWIRREMAWDSSVFFPYVANIGPCHGDEGNDGEGKGRNIESASGSRAGWASEATVPIQHCHSNHGSKEKQVDNGAEEGEKRDASETACE